MGTHGIREGENMGASSAGETTIAAHMARRRDNFLLLRIVAALAVIYGHSFVLAKADGSNDIFLRNGWPFYSGDIAVMMFFVISGFMVSGSYIARANLADFMTARLLRIDQHFGYSLGQFAIHHQRDLQPFCISHPTPP